MRTIDMFAIAGFVVLVVLFAGPVFWSTSNETVAGMLWRKLIGLFQKNPPKGPT